MLTRWHEALHPQIITGHVDVLVCCQHLASYWRCFCPIYCHNLSLSRISMSSPTSPCSSLALSLGDTRHASVTGSCWRLRTIARELTRSIWAFSWHLFGKYILAVPRVSLLLFSYCYCLLLLLHSSRFVNWHHEGSLFDPVLPFCHSSMQWSICKQVISIYSLQMWIISSTRQNIYNFLNW